MTTPLPAAADFTGAAVTESDFKVKFAALRAYLAEQFGDTGLPLDARRALGVPLAEVVEKTANYTATATDCGKALRFTGAGPFTLAFAGVAGLGNGWSLTVINDSAAALTLDPNLGELVDGMATFSLPAWQRVSVVCDALRLVTSASSPVSSVGGNIGAVTNAQLAASVNAANGGTPALSGHTHTAYVTKDANLGVGCFALLLKSVAVAEGATSAGSSLGFSSADGSSSGGTPLGTWRCHGYSVGNGEGGSPNVTVWQRIA